MRLHLPHSQFLFVIICLSLILLSFLFFFSFFFIILHSLYSPLFFVLLCPFLFYHTAFFFVFLVLLLSIIIISYKYKLFLMLSFNKSTKKEFDVINPFFLCCTHRMDSRNIKYPSLIPIETRHYSNVIQFSSTYTYLHQHTIFIIQ